MILKYTTKDGYSRTIACADDLEYELNEAFVKEGAEKVVNPETGEEWLSKDYKNMKCRLCVTITRGKYCKACKRDIEKIDFETLKIFSKQQPTHL